MTKIMSTHSCSFALGLLWVSPNVRIPRTPRCRSPVMSVDHHDRTVRRGQDKTGGERYSDSLPSYRRWFGHQNLGTAIRIVSENLRHAETTQRPRTRPSRTIRSPPSNTDGEENRRNLADTYKFPRCASRISELHITIDGAYNNIALKNRRWRVGWRVRQ